MRRTGQMTKPASDDQDSEQHQEQTRFDDWGMITMIMVLTLTLWFLIRAGELGYSSLLGNPAWRLGPSSDFAIPSIHAALLAVLIPVIAAYAIYVNGIRGQFERSVFEEAAKVNEIR